ncbi:MAG: hypothetical protein ACI8ZN_001851 [Bacteroidia bacterium]|jgi:hypothetical protein
MYQTIKAVRIILVLPFSLLLSCQTTVSSNSSNPQSRVSSHQLEVKNVGAIPTPKGFERVDYSAGHMASYLRNIRLKTNNQVMLYNGELKWNQSYNYAVLDIDIGNKNLQQCADATMRLRAEHLYQLGKYEDIKFHFTSGHLATWQAYSKGYRPKISGSSVHFVKSADVDTSYANFRAYLDLIFTYCGTHSMRKEVINIKYKDVEPGDVLLQNGNPYGHAITIMDVAQDSSGKRLVLLSQSYMPAQDIHILHNFANSNQNPWYYLVETLSTSTPEWTFPAHALVRWMRE